MVMLKNLKPYHIKIEKDYVRIVLAYQYFSIEMNKKVYQFIPVEANEVKVCRKTKKIENLDAVFAFQNGKDIINLTMGKLMSLPDFIEHVDGISKEYYHRDSEQIQKENESVLNNVIIELEKQNILRLIDRALDERDQESFSELTELLNSM